MRVVKLIAGIVVALFSIVALAINAHKIDDGAADAGAAVFFVAAAGAGLALAWSARRGKPREHQAKLERLLDGEQKPKGDDA